jgi:hypothetical protein
MVAATVPAAVESAAAGVHTSAATSMTAAMLSKCGRRNQDEGRGSREKSLQQGGFVHGLTLQPTTQVGSGYRRGNPILLRVPFQYESCTTSRSAMRLLKTLLDPRKCASAAKAAIHLAGLTARLEAEPFQNGHPKLAFQEPARGQDWRT